MKWLIFVIIITLVYVVQQGYFEPKIKEQQEQESALIKEYAETIKTAKKLAQQTADKVEERQKEIQMQIQSAESGMGG